MVTCRSVSHFPSGAIRIRNVIPFSSTSAGAVLLTVVSRTNRSRAYRSTSWWRAESAVARTTRCLRSPTSTMSTKSLPISIRTVNSAGCAEWLSRMICSWKQSWIERCRMTDTSAST